jgi:hypothetical protein
MVSLSSTSCYQQSARGKKTTATTATAREAERASLVCRLRARSGEDQGKGNEGESNANDSARPRLVGASWRHVWPFGSQLSERSLGKITVRGNVFPFGSQLSERSLRKITVRGNVFKTTLPSPLIFFKKSSHIIKYVWFAPHM